MNRSAKVYVRTDARDFALDTTVDALKAALPEKRLRKVRRPYHSATHPREPPAPRGAAAPDESSTFRAASSHHSWHRVIPWHGRLAHACPITRCELQGASLLDCHQSQSPCQGPGTL